MINTDSKATNLHEDYERDGLNNLYELETGPVALKIVTKKKIFIKST
jgi:hypothetical protein